MVRRSTHARLALAAAALLALSACKRGGTPAPGPAPSSAASSSVSAAPPGAPRCALEGPRFERRSVEAQSSAIELVGTSAGSFVVLADHDEMALHAFEAGSLQQVGVTPLPGRPGHVRALSTGHLAVTLRDTGVVLLMAPADAALRGAMRRVCEAPVPGEPWGIAEHAGKVAVTAATGATLSMLGALEGVVERAIAVPHEPRAVLLLDEGKTAWVSHAKGGALTVVDLGADQPSASAVPLFATKTKPDAKSAGPTPASQGHALAEVRSSKPGQPGTLRLLAPFVSVDPGERESTVTDTYGSPMSRAFSPVVAVIDATAKRSVTTQVVGAHFSPGTLCTLPRSALVHRDSLFVACADLDEVLELDARAADAFALEKRRIAVASGPVALSLSQADGRLFVWSENDRVVTREANGELAQAAPWRRAGVHRDAQIEQGRRLFTTSLDARLGPGRPCAGCHPDGRDDGLSWTSPGGLRSTPSLAGRLDRAAPFGWRAESATLRDHIARTPKRNGGSGLAGDKARADLDALVAYVASLQRPPATPAADAARARRGKGVFERAGCATCHPGGHTDGASHDVGTGSAGSRFPAYDTPSLVAVRSSAPYLHDGRFATLDALLSAPLERHAQPLSDDDRSDLIAYLETL